MEPYQHNLLRYYEEAAIRYSTDIEPVFGQLAALLVTTAQLSPGDRVLDIGTGTGIAARYAASAGCQVAALDFAHGMAVAAVNKATPGVVQGEMHRLPFAELVFDHVLSEFAMNSARPVIAMKDAWRVLKSKGRLALQEWGTDDVVSNLLQDILAEYTVDNPPDELARKRLEQQVLHPWDELDTSDDILQLMEQAGFVQVSVQIETASVTVSNAAAFIRAKLAWPIRRAEIQAMSEDVRQLCLNDLEENIGELTQPDGRLHWEPNVVLVVGTKSTN